ncbi:hypothetical protein ANN_02776 [Periplaneta americana]|uniref:Uncharacterized protein n=1 Tax=Periplaneta americana TaxID=6978 RepID=A0ABQ8TX95_PERAM|nr:hypothetical protein ANN_02776 [Periplaneta americana]
MAGLCEGGNEPPGFLKAIYKSSVIPEGIDARKTAKKELVGSLAEKKLPIEDALEGMVNGRRVRKFDKQIKGMMETVRQACCRLRNTYGWKLQWEGAVMGKRRGVFRKLVAFVCALRGGRHGKVRCGSVSSIKSSVFSISPVEVVLTCDGAASYDGEDDTEPETTVSIAGTATSRGEIRFPSSPRRQSVMLEWRRADIITHPREDTTSGGDSDNHTINNLPSNEKPPPVRELENLSENYMEWKGITVFVLGLPLYGERIRKKKEMTLDPWFLD